MALPNINMEITNTIWGLPTKGNLVYKYSAFQNLQNLDITKIGQSGLIDLQMTAEEANINTEKPLGLTIEESYDTSANLLISDKVNPLKIVNSRFYLTSSSDFVIADRKGNLDTNIYTKTDFPIEAGLIKTVRSIVGLDFEGIDDGGILPVGNYNFYFKLADYDGNESDFISESGQVVCYIGAVNNIKSVRGGQLDENSNKLVKFQLNNLDLAYDYINIYYTRNSGDELNKTTTAYKITNKFKILGTSTKISITGYEETEEIASSDINVNYANFDSAESLDFCQNMLFVGNTTNNYDVFSILEKYSLRVTPTVTYDENIGNVNSRYSGIGNEYYNPDNIYYKLGHWDNELYRFGIVYIMNDYTLSPVFNIRGKKEIDVNTEFNSFPINEEINFNDDYIIEGTDDSGNFQDENTKGVFRINTDPDETNSIFNGADNVKPLGIKFSFDSSLFDLEDLSHPKVTELTKGFFIVRQKRIPTILAQGVSIGTTREGNIPTVKASTSKGGSYFLESFLTQDGATPILKRSIYGLEDADVSCNALFCPEATLRSDVYGSLFNSSSFRLMKDKYKPGVSEKFIKLDTEDKLFALSDLIVNDSYDETPLDSELLLIKPNTELISNDDVKFSSVAGNESVAWKHVDPIYGDIEKLTEYTSDMTDATLSRSAKKTRGVFNSYIGSSESLLSPGKYYNVYNKGFDFEKYWKSYFKIRYNDSSPFYPISDRTVWSKLTDNENKINCYRGDCYISTYTHRVISNFVDPELPTNQRIVDKYSWFKNYKVKTTDIKFTDNDFVIEDTANEFGDSYKEKVTYKKVLPAFTYKAGDIIDDIDTGKNLYDVQVLTPEARKYKKYSESNGIFGYSKLNRPDINAVDLGHWVTFKIRSNVNLSLRDENFSNPEEEAIHNKKRSFYPYSSADQNSKLLESTIINRGISSDVGNKLYFEIPDVPFIKTNFTTRIYHSNLSVDSLFKDGSRIFKYDSYRDYTIEHGKLIKLIEWYGTLIAVMEHGVLQIPVNERAAMTNASGENVYINTDNPLPANPKVLSNTFGSVWSESIVKTPRFVYGIDTIGKKIWRTNGESFEIISDLKIQKFLNDNINLKVTDRDESIDSNLIKSHYNAFKHDVIFTYKYGSDKWSLCWNETLNKWITRYSWFPEFSENINNIFYTFANETEHSDSKGKLFKHGFAGTLEEQGNVKPTVWYEEQHPFEFEFVVIGVQGVQKIFDNLKIISNKAKPNSFTYEIVGEGYDWYKFKEVISWMENHSSFNEGVISENIEFSIMEDGYYSINDTSPDDFIEGYTYLLTHTIDEIESDYPDFPTPYGMIGTDTFKKLPYIPKVKTQSVLDEIDWGSLNYDTALINDLWNGEDRVLLYQEGKEIRYTGRLRGNMDYIEDSWDIQIQPVKFRYAFMKNDELTFSKVIESEVRDKYTKIKVKYDGTKLAIINAIRTLFTLSYA